MTLASLPVTRHHNRKHLFNLPNRPRRRLRDLDRLLAETRSPRLLLPRTVGVMNPPLRPSSVHRPRRRAPYTLFLKGLATKPDAKRILLVRKLLGKISSLAEEGEVRVGRVGRASRMVRGAVFLGVGE